MSAIPADPSRRAAHAGVLAAAFADDPVLSWVFRNPATRLRYGRGFFDHTLRRLAPDGLTWTTADEAGVSVWAAPGHWRVSALESLRMWRLLPGMVPHAPRTLLALAGVEARHPHSDHAYLAAVGVAPGRQGEGLGSTLIAPGLAWADERGLPAYLESSNPRNVPLYERHGFRVTSVLRLPSGPPVSLMWRDAR